jgi:hypothetical protein
MCDRDPEEWRAIAKEKETKRTRPAARETRSHQAGPSRGRKSVREKEKHSYRKGLTPAPSSWMANKGLTVYGTWKSAQTLENKAEISDGITLQNDTKARAYWLEGCNPSFGKRKSG